MLLGIRQQTAPYVQDKTARDMLASLKITAQDNEVRVSADIPNEVAQGLFSSTLKKGEKREADLVLNPAPVKKKTTTTTQRRRTRRRTTH